MHGKRRTKAEFDKFNDLVFVHCNLWLQATAKSRNGKYQPINFDEIDVSSEWPTESEASSPLLDDAVLDYMSPDINGVS